MREDEIIGQIIQELEDATPTDVDVRTDGGDQTASPPEVILSASTTRINENGAKALAEVLRDDSGDALGQEFHIYFRMELECIVRYFDEVKRDQVLDDIHDAFLPYEYDATQFNRDTAEWEILGGASRHNSIVEKDWYTGSTMLTFKYVKRTDQSGPQPIDTINTDVQPDETIEGTSTDTNS